MNGEKYKYLSCYIIFKTTKELLKRPIAYVKCIIKLKYCCKNNYIESVLNE